MNRRKIIYSILKEIEKNEIEPKAEHFGISKTDFGDMVDIIENEELIKGSEVIRDGKNEVLMTYLNTARITMEGMEYLGSNSSFAKTYKGLKEIREWLKL